MTRNPTCADVLGGDPDCIREPHGKDVYHSDGVRVWRYATPDPAVEWIRRVRDGRTSLARINEGGAAR